MEGRWPFVSDRDGEKGVFLLAVGAGFAAYYLSPEGTIEGQTERILFAVLAFIVAMIALYVLRWILHW
jgi:hypothetical protein